MNQKHQILEIVSFNVNNLQNVKENAVSQDSNFELKSIIGWPYRTYSESTVQTQIAMIDIGHKSLPIIIGP